MDRSRFALALLLFCLLLPPAPAAAQSAPAVILPRSGLEPADVAVIVNEADPLSMEIGAYYAARRGIPAQNVVGVRLSPEPTVTGPEVAAAKARADAALPAHVQAYALAWARPFRAGCMSITSAFALGYDEKWCAKGCNPTAASPLFNADTHRPWDDLGVRPAMLLAAENLEDARRLIDRGINADRSWPKGAAYLLETADAARSVRAAQFPEIVRLMGSALPVKHIKAQSIRDRKDVLFYFTGLAHVPDVAANRYLPGAMADHLTSTGGVLLGGQQMSALRWLEAGATASYGTVVEPCNFPGKFPSPGLAMARSLNGETLLEAYWKSVAMPGQGVFIGEPLAAPFAGARVRRSGKFVEVEARSLEPGPYALLASADGLPPYLELGRVLVGEDYPQRFRFAAPGPEFASGVVLMSRVD